MQPTRRSYSNSFKAQVLQERAQPDASIASIALRHNLNANSSTNGFVCKRRKAQRVIADAELTLLPTLLFPHKVSSPKSDLLTLYEVEAWVSEISAAGSTLHQRQQS